MMPFGQNCRPRSLSDLGVRREGKRDRNQNLCKFEANSELFNENLRGFWPISAFPQQNHPKSDRLLESGAPSGGLSECTTAKFGNFVFPKLGHTAIGFPGTPEYI
uniref:Uncharacterized protein n=1 Tax=Candidatus Kentrum sp. DK TaxID=2126562 RepID=A0A450T1Q9_9GAMM|nr:MAG: hypothetical protein BECKDK2373C_GA0170839_10812 [Candidatus Kentron sp. DK]